MRALSRISDRSGVDDRSEVTLIALAGALSCISE
jgi:hypothetical protein